MRRVAREVVEHAVRHESNVLGEVETSCDDEEGEEEEEDGIWRMDGQLGDKTLYCSIPLGIYASNCECAAGSIDTGLFRGGFRSVSAPRRRILGARRVGNGVCIGGTYSE